jgi:hypothetical protein
MPFSRIHGLLRLDYSVDLILIRAIWKKGGHYSVALMEREGELFERWGRERRERGRTVWRFVCLDL